MKFTYSKEIELNEGFVRGVLNCLDLPFFINHVFIESDDVGIGANIWLGLPENVEVGFICVNNNWTAEINFNEIGFQPIDTIKNYLEEIEKIKNHFERYLKIKNDKY